MFAVPLVFDTVIEVMFVNVSQGAVSSGQSVAVGLPMYKPPSAALRTAPSMTDPAALALGLR